MSPRVATDSAREPNTVDGGGGPNTILTGLGNDSIYGDDELHGQGGNDFVKGGPGSDLLYGDDYFASRDTVRDSDFGGLGADRALADAIDLVYNAVRL